MGKIAAYMIATIMLIIIGITIIGKGNQQNDGFVIAKSSEMAKKSLEQKQAPELNDKSDNAAIIANMSLDEKIGQMMIAGVSGTSLNGDNLNLISKYKVGGIILYANNLESPNQTIDLLNEIKTKNVRNRLPLLLGVDQEGGEVSRLPGDLINLPSNKHIGEQGNGGYSYTIGSMLGKQLTAFGFNLDFAPVLDVNSNPDNPVIGDRSFGNNPEIVSDLGIQTMKGIQSEGIISVIKHFPGHGDTSVDSHLELPRVNKSLKELHRLELIPFERAIQNGADVVMVAHILLPKIDPEFPSSMSPKIIDGILRNQFAFSGVVMTDDMTMKAITDNFDIGQAAVESVKAGNDMILVAHGYHNVITVIKALEDAVHNGELTEERINESVSRIIHLKRKYDISNRQTESINIRQLNKIMETAL
ncbi:beta-N-acetylhexosaminidase [Virgibacillus dakarensis]|uniref:beta-N-acetylhexosaminidase n=1 Tax=Virgibacillus dakarensis TaxID=1917889 RepID=UPI000B452DF2|nr:beta-N-acetylhexosaminidase [Virgibacillus dakarensis]